MSNKKIKEVSTKENLTDWLVYSIAAANGLIEALIAVLIGTPIILALQQIQKNR